MIVISRNKKEDKNFKFSKNHNFFQMLSKREHLKVYLFHIFNKIDERIHAPPKKTIVCCTGKPMATVFHKKKSSRVV